MSIAGPGRSGPLANLSAVPLRQQGLRPADHQRDEEEADEQLLRGGQADAGEEGDQRATKPCDVSSVKPRYSGPIP